MRKLHPELTTSLLFGIQLEHGFLIYTQRLFTILGAPFCFGVNEFSYPKDSLILVTFEMQFPQTSCETNGGIQIDGITHTVYTTQWVRVYVKAKFKEQK